VSTRKILLVTNDLGPRAGGIETFILGLLDQLDGSQIVIYTAAQTGSDQFDKILSAKTGVIILRDKSSVLLPTPWVNRRVRAVALRFESEVIWFGAAMPLAWMSGLLKRAGAKRIVAITHGHEVWWAKLPPFRQIFAQSTKSIDVLTYLGQFTRRAMAPVVSARCAMVHIAPGISIQHFTPGAKSQKLIDELDLEGKQVLISVGRLVHRKGQDKLLEALPQILLTHPDIILLFVGVGPRQKKLDQLVRSHELSNYIRFVGRIAYDALPDYFRLGDLFVMPSRSRLAGLEVEGLGIVYLEASACGIPVVAGASGGAPDAIIQGKTGLVVDGTKVDEIARTINELLDNPTQLAAMGQAGRAWTVERWSWQIWGERFREVLLGN
jgi:phosphatidyl-myo-inositol dimannoside synthase